MREYEIYERLVIVTASMRVHSFFGLLCLASFIFENVMLFLGYIFFDLSYIVINIFLILGFFENKNLFEKYTKEYDELQEELKNLFDK